MTPAPRSPAGLADTRHRALPAMLVIGVFGLLSLLGGWLVVCGSGFQASNGPHAADAAFIAGLPALFMALLQFLAAALALAWLLRRWLNPVRAALLAIALVGLPPLVYLLGGPGG